jgi:hypothetical protein
MTTVALNISFEIRSSQYWTCIASSVRQSKLACFVSVSVAVSPDFAWNCMELHEKHDFNIFMLHGTAWNCMKQHETA